MSSREKIWLAVLAVCAIGVVLLGAFSPDSLDDHDQAKPALYVLDIWQNHNFLMQESNGGLATKPPLFNWLCWIVCVLTASCGEWQLRIPSMLASLALVGLTVCFGRRLHSWAAGIIAGFILISNFHFASLCAMVRTDMLLTLFLTLALYLFYRGLELKNVLAFDNTLRALRSLLDKDFTKEGDHLILLGWGMLALAALTKGPLLILAPPLIMTLYLWKLKQPRQALQLNWSSGLLLAIIPMAVWFGLCLYQHGTGYWEVVKGETINRVAGISSRGEEAKPFYYFLPHLFGRFAPWSILLIPAFAFLWKDRRAVLPLIWTAAFLVLVSLSRGKRADYIFPLYPGASLAVAILLVKIPELFAERWHGLLKWICVSLGGILSIVGIAITIMPNAPGLFGKKILEQADLVASVQSHIGLMMICGAIVFAGGLLTMYATFKRRPRVICGALTGVGIAYLFVYFFVLSEMAVKKYGENQKALVSAVKEIVGDTSRVRLLKTDFRGVSFLLGVNKPVVKNPVENAWYLTTEKDLVDCPKNIPISIMHTGKQVMKDIPVPVLVWTGAIPPAVNPVQSEVKTEQAPIVSTPASIFTPQRTPVITPGVVPKKNIRKRPNSNMRTTELLRRTGARNFSVTGGTLCVLSSPVKNHPVAENESVDELKPANTPAPSPEEKLYEEKIKEVQKQLGPEFLVKKSPPFVVASRKSSDALDDIIKNTIQNFFNAIRKHYLPKNIDGIIVVYLFSGAEEYKTWNKKLFGEEPTTPYGYFSPSKKAMVMNIDTGGGTLIHEMVHPLMDANFPDAPKWINEGLASLFECCGLNRDGLILGGVNWRLPGLQKAIKEKRVIPLKELLAAPDRDFSGDKGGLCYAESRYLCFYLQEHGLMRKFFKAFMENAKEDPTGLKTLEKITGKKIDVLEKEWIEWSAKLKYQR